MKSLLFNSMSCTFEPLLRSGCCQLPRIAHGQSADSLFPPHTGTFQRRDSAPEKLLWPQEGCTVGLARAGLGEHWDEQTMEVEAGSPWITFMAPLLTPAGSASPLKGRHFFSLSIWHSSHPAWFSAPIIDTWKFSPYEISPQRLCPPPPAQILRPSAQINTIFSPWVCSFDFSFSLYNFFHSASLRKT